MGAQVVVEAAQDLRAAIKLHHMRAEAVHDASKFTGDVTGADDRDAVRPLGQFEHLVRGYSMLGTRHRRNDGPGTGRDQNVFGGESLARGEPDLVRAIQHRAGIEDLHPSIAQRAPVGRLKTGDLGVLGRDQLGPVEARPLEAPAEARRILEGIAKAAGVNEQLLGDASSDHAGTTRTIFLGETDARARLCRDPRRTHAARTAAYDEKIEIELVRGHPDQAS